MLMRPGRHCQAMSRARTPTPADRDLWVRLGRNLRAKREADGRSIEDVAIAAGLSRNYLSELETGIKPPSLVMLRALADELETPVWELLRPPVDASPPGDPNE